MSYFKCSHGGVYYPFGKGGRDRLIEAAQRRAGAGAGAGSGSGSGAWKSGTATTLSDCKWHSLPLEEDVSGGSGNVATPLVLRCPSAPSSVVIGDLCADVLRSILRNILDAVQVRSLLY